jgi:hypothetical protein
MKRKSTGSPGRYLRLDLFIKVLSLLCPNLTDASCLFLSFLWRSEEGHEKSSVGLDTGPRLIVGQEETTV